MRGARRHRGESSGRLRPCSERWKGRLGSRNSGQASPCPDSMTPRMASWLAYGGFPDSFVRANGTPCPKRTPTRSFAPRSAAVAEAGACLEARGASGARRRRRRTDDIQPGSAKRDPLVAGLRWTRGAGLWMRDIFEYIAHDNPKAAARLVEGVYARAQVLTEFPGSDRSSL